MGKITVDDLKAIREKAAAAAALRSGKASVTLTVHMDDCGLAAGARDVMTALLEERAKTGKIDVNILAGPCRGTCTDEPALTVSVKGSVPVLYGRLDPDKARRIFHRHIVDGDILPEYMVTTPA
jgi:(2Fe-2S) ferredoxin